MSRHPFSSKLAATVAAALLAALVAVSVALASSTSGPGTATHRTTAITDAAALLANVTPPTAATQTSHTAGTGPAGDHLLTTALDSAWAQRSWSVTGDPGAVLSSVTSQLPSDFSVVSRGSGGGPGESSISVTYSRPPVPGVLDVRWLEIGVNTTSHGTVLSAQAQSQWVVARPSDEQIPAGVTQVAISDGVPCRP